MHEMSLINDLIHKMEGIARQRNVSKITKARVRLGALSHISADHFREHFVEGTKGTVAEGAVLEIEISEDLAEPHAQDILLLSVDILDKE